MTSRRRRAAPGRGRAIGRIVDLSVAEHGCVSEPYTCEWSFEAVIYGTFEAIIYGARISNLWRLDEAIIIWRF